MYLYILNIFCCCSSYQENIKSLVHTTKSIEATRTHLQGQLRNKEAENNRLTVHLRVKTLHPVNLKL